MRPGPCGPPQSGRESEVINWADTRTAVDLVAPKWVLPVIAALTTGQHRHGELLRAIGTGLSDKVLTETLRRMQREGLVARHLLDCEATAVGYALTPLGESLLVALAELSRWTNDHRPELAPHRRGDRRRDRSTGRVAQVQQVPSR